MVDFVLPPRRCRRSSTTISGHCATPRPARAATASAARRPTICRQICALLRARTGHDFSGYKDKTVVRRVQRRMQVLQIDEVPEATSSGCARSRRRLDALLQDLLIGVTNFFRDPQAFEALEREVIPQLFEGKGPDDRGPRLGARLLDRRGGLFDRHPAARADVAGAHARRTLQIFASDIDERGAADRPARPLSRRPIAERRPAGPAGALFRARGRHLPHRRRAARDLPVLLAQSAARRAVLQARPDRLPQPADLPDAGAAEPADPAVPLRAARRRLPVPRHLGERDAAFPAVQHRRQGASHLPAAGPRSSRGCRNSR